MSIKEQNKINKELRDASKIGDVNKVKYLITQGANVCYKDNVALNKASEKGHTEVIKCLIENGADIHANDDYALRASARYNHAQTVQYLLETGSDILAEENHALRCAVQLNNLDVISVLLLHYNKLVDIVSTIDGDMYQWANDYEKYTTKNKSSTLLIKKTNEVLYYMSYIDKETREIIAQNKKITEFKEKIEKDLVSDFTGNKTKRNKV